MTTLKQKSSYFIIMLVLCCSSIMAQQQTNKDFIFSFIPEKTFETLKDYNNFVKTLDLKKLTSSEKEWLEDQYNGLIEKIEDDYHLPKVVDTAKKISFHKMPFETLKA